MGDRRWAYTDRRYGGVSVLLRGWSLGATWGAFTGAAVGTCIAPLIGTVYGFFVGGVVAVLLGLPCALTLAAVAPLLTRERDVRVAGAVTSVVWGVVGVFFLDPWLVNVVVVTVGLVLCAGVGAIVAPRAVLHRIAVEYEGPAVVGTPIDGREWHAA